MDRKDFQTLAVRTESIANPTVGPDDKLIFTAALDAYVQATEILDIYKKHMFYGKELDMAAVQKHASQASDAMGAVHFCLDHGGSIKHDNPGDMVLPCDPRVFHALLGTITEHGEIATALQKSFAADTELDLVNVCEELGDSDWYKALFFEATGIDWESVQAMIIKKLEIRYKDKIFGAGEAIERDLEAERALLESEILAAVEEYKASAT